MKVVLSLFFICMLLQSAMGSSTLKAELAVAGSSQCVDGGKRCGPLFGGKYCAGNPSWAIYCVSSNGWCGDSSGHANADPETKYDHSAYLECLQKNKPETMAVCRCDQGNAGAKLCEEEVRYYTYNTYTKKTAHYDYNCVPVPNNGACKKSTANETFFKVGMNYSCCYRTKWRVCQKKAELAVAGSNQRRESSSETAVAQDYPLAEETALAQDDSYLAEASVAGSLQARVGDGRTSYIKGTVFGMCLMGAVVLTYSVLTKKKEGLDEYSNLMEI